MCSRWLTSFENFFQDMGPRPKGKTIDRIDNDKGYSPENCRWANSQTQQNNKRSNVQLEYNGESFTVTSFVRYMGLDYPSFYRYYREQNLPIEEAIYRSKNRWRKKSRG